MIDHFAIRIERDVESATPGFPYENLVAFDNGNGMGNFVMMIPRLKRIDGWKLLNFGFSSDSNFLDDYGGVVSGIHRSESANHSIVCDFITGDREKRSSRKDHHHS